MIRNITDVRGFRARGAHIGIKSKRRDLALIVSDVPASAAAVYTQNQVVAAPVTLTKKHLKNGLAQAVVVTSGNANACTGDKGKEAALTVAETTAEELGIPVEEVVVSATGVIGVEFPIDKVVRGIRTNVKHLTDKRVSGSMVANAIMTTDTFQKEGFSTFNLSGARCFMAGVAKGAGMIHPDMATMLAFIVTDVNITPKLLQEALDSATRRSFNMISVDGDTSTNDMALVMANGLAGNPRIEKRDDDYHRFRMELEKMCVHLAKLIVSDGEGATKFIEYRVNNAKDEEGARQIVRTISNSNLVRTAIFGRDPNWGRVLAAIGRSGVKVDVDKVDIWMGSTKRLEQVCASGGVADFDKGTLRKILRSSQIRVLVDLHMGKESAVGWGTDFSYEYVRINAAYTT